MSELFQSSVSAAEFVRSNRKHFSDKDAAAVLSGKPASVTLTKVQVTPEKASKFINEMSSFLQRRVNKEHAFKLFYAMTDNKFDSEIDPILVFIYQDQAFFAGGYHRMIAQKYAEKTYSYTIIVRAFDNFDDMQTTYTLTHGRKAASRSEVNEMALFDQSEITQQGKRNTVVSAAKIIITRDWDPQMAYVPGDTSDNAGTALSKLYIAEAVRVNEIVGQKGTHAEFKRRFVGVPYAAMLVLMRTQPVRTTMFLERARQTGGLVADSAELHFHNWVRTRTTTSGEKGRGEQVKEIGYIWHKYLRGETFKRITPNNTDKVDYTRLAGVPEKPRGVAVRITDSKVTVIQKQIARQGKFLDERKERALTEFWGVNLAETDKEAALVK